MAIDAPLTAASGSFEPHGVRPRRRHQTPSEGSAVLPWVVLRAIDDDQDWLSAAYATSPEFWQMIQQRRQEQGIPWEEARKQLDLE